MGGWAYLHGCCEKKPAAVVTSLFVWVGGWVGEFLAFFPSVLFLIHCGGWVGGWVGGKRHV